MRVRVPGEQLDPCSYFMRKEVSRLKGVIWVLIRIVFVVLLGRKIWLDFKAVVDSYPEE